MRLGTGVSGTAGASGTDYRRIILNRLLDRYEASRHYSEPGVSTRGVFLRFTLEEFPDYHDDTSADYRREINRAVQDLARFGLIRFVWARLGEGRVIDRVYLNLESLEGAYSQARRVPRADKERALAEIAERWRERWISGGGVGAGEIAGAVSGGCPVGWRLRFVGDILGALESKIKLPLGLSPEAPGVFEDVLRFLDAVPGLRDDVPRRVLSVKLYSDSKRLEALHGKLAQILRRYALEDRENEVSGWDDREVLAEFGVVDNPQHIFIAGPITLEIAGQEVRVADFRPDVGLSASALANCSVIGLASDTVITVENLTSYARLAGQVAGECGVRNGGEAESAAASWVADRPPVVIYLGGFPSRFQKRFLSILGDHAQKKNPRVRFLHWGDLDLGGFRVFCHLRQASELPLEPYRMDRETYLAYLEYGSRFDDAYARKLKALLNRPEYEVFREVIEEMLRQRVRVEQECLDV